MALDEAARMDAHEDARGAAQQPTGVDLSVVIGFKDWGLTRLSLAIESLRASFGDLTGEVIVSDYGSANAAEVEEVVLRAGGRYVYTDGQGVWSRSRALNIGFGQAGGKVLVCTDADMLFSPGSMETIFRKVVAAPDTTFLLECRDLPQEWDDARVQREGADWDLFEGISKLRGRWGMGGMIAVTREVFRRVRGLDERMHTYGCEDIDFGERTQRSGNKLVWIEDPGVRMFHMWHRSTDDAMQKAAETLEIINANRKILYEDASIARNLTSWLAGSVSRERPLVTVAIATRNRSHLLRQAIHSVQAQTLQDFEIVVVDDGSETDAARLAVESIGDPRVRYEYQEQRGIAAARNRATELARGRYIAVLDDDDIMLPWRLESQVQAVSAGYHGSYGSFVNFDHATAELKLFHEKQIGIDTVFRTGGAPGHSTWLVERDLFEAVPYDESIPSGEDNNVMLRMLRCGARFKHSGNILSLRRIHGAQVTQNDGKMHQRIAESNRLFLRFNATERHRDEVEAIGDGKPWIPVPGRDDVDAFVRPYLPDHLSRKMLICDEMLPGEVLDRFRQQESLGRLQEARRTSVDGEVLQSRSVIRDAGYETMAFLRLAGVDFEVRADDGSQGQPMDLLDSLILDAMTSETGSDRAPERASERVSGARPEARPEAGTGEVYHLLSVGPEDAPCALTGSRSIVSASDERYAIVIKPFVSLADAVRAYRGLRSTQSGHRLEIWGPNLGKTFGKALESVEAAAR